MMKPMGRVGVFENLRDRVRELKREVIALSIAARNPATPLLAKVITGLVVAYALSPIDLIPDFIPVLGVVDDLILIPLGIVVAIRLVPSEVMDRARVQAAEVLDRPKSWAGAFMVILVWVSALVFLLARFGIPV